MTSQFIPACLDCKHCYNIMDDDLPLYSCKFHTFERPDYIKGRVVKIDMLAFDAREDENRCGFKGKNFEQREVPVRTRLKRLINAVWRYFSRYDAELL